MTHVGAGHSVGRLTGLPSCKRYFFLPTASLNLGGTPPRTLMTQPTSLPSSRPLAPSGGDDNRSMKTPLVSNPAFVRASDQVSAVKRIHGGNVPLCPT